MASTLLYLFIFKCLFICSLAQTKHQIDIYRLTSLTSTAGPTITGAEWLAIQEINNKTNFLANYEFNLKVYGNANKLNDALHDLLKILHEQSNTCAINENNSSNASTHYFLPILLGVQRSSISTLIASVAGVNNMGLISATSTSVALSETKTYPFFYRTIASDALQSKGLIFLCDTFNWTRIIVVYNNDAYGLHLSLGIQEIGKFHNIDVTSVAIEYENDLTYLYAARQIKQIEKYIIILILNSRSVADLLHIFDTEGLLGYPYFYLGVDSWIDSTTITQELGNKTKGFIGTLPWNINTLDLNEYGNDIIDVVNIASVKTNNLLNAWNYRYEHGDSDELRIETPRGYVVYAYDVMYAVANAIHEIETKYGEGALVDMLINNSSQQIMKVLNDSIINHVNFIGASGHVTFDSNGDRQNGFFSFGNILGEGVVEYIGYFLENKELANATGIDSIKSHINLDKIVWPQYFTEKGIIPHSDIITYQQILVVNSSLSITIFILCGLFICIISSAVIFIICHRKNIIIKRGSWRMNTVMCFGCILSFIAAILFGIDEQFISEKTSMSIICEMRLFSIVVGFTLTVMPLFLKTWRLIQIFNDMTQVKKIYDNQLFLYILVCSLVDIFSLLIFVLIEPYQRIYNNGSITKIDELQQTQQIYGICLFSDRNGSDLIFYFYVVLILWKFGQLLFGIYCAFNVARIQDNPNANINVLNRFLKFDETSSQLSSIGFTFVVICIAVVFAALIPIDSPTAKYAVISITILIIGIIIFTLNLSQRIIAVIRNDNVTYEKSMEQKFKEIFKKKILKIEAELKRIPTDLRAATSVSSSPAPNTPITPDMNKTNVPDVVNDLALYIEQSQ